MQKQPLPEPKEDLLKRCKHCGRSHVKQRTKCPAFGKLCSACNKPNHIAEMCRRTSGKNSRPRNGVNKVNSEDSSEEELLSVSFDSYEGNVHMRSTKTTFLRRKSLRQWKSQVQVSECILTRVLHVMSYLRNMCPTEHSLLRLTVL